MEKKHHNGDGESGMSHGKIQLVHHLIFILKLHIGRNTVLKR